MRPTFALPPWPGPSLGALLVLCASASAPVGAQDIQPRVYTAAPIGVNAISLGYAFSTGEVLFDKTIPLEDVTGDVHSISLSYSRSLALLGQAARLDVVVPWVTGDWSGRYLEAPAAAVKSGLGDPVLRLVLPISGAPALEPSEFASFRPRTIIATTLRVGVPLGRYDTPDLINLGSNRWWIGPQFGVSHVDGPLLLESYLGARFFSANRDFLGSSELTQSPLFTIQLHAGYRFRRGFWLAASTRQSFGGATAVDGGDKVNPETNNRVGLTLNVPVLGRYAIRVVGSTGLTATVGNNYDTFSVIFSAAF